MRKQPGWRWRPERVVLIVAAGLVASGGVALLTGVETSARPVTEQVIFSGTTPKADDPTSQSPERTPTSSDPTGPQDRTSAVPALYSPRQPVAVEGLTPGPTLATPKTSSSTTPSLITSLLTSPGNPEVTVPTRRSPTPSVTIPHTSTSSVPTTLPPLSIPGGTEDWPMLQGGAQHDGQSDETGPLLPTESWIFSSPPGVVAISPAPVAVVDKIAYLAYNDFGIFYVDAISITTHKLVWDWSNIGYLGPASLAVGSDGTVYLSDGSLVAISPGGEVKWTFTTDSGEFGPPTVGPDGTIYVDGLGPQLFAVDPGDGHVLWSYQARASGVDSPIASTPALSADGKTLYDSEGGSLLAFSAGSGGGKPLWSDQASPDGADFDAAPAVGPDGTIYIDTAGSQYCTPVCSNTAGDVEALRPDGSLKWSYQGSAPFFTSPAVSDTGLVIETDANGITTALSQITGKVAWKDTVGAPTAGLPSNPPAAAIGATGNIFIAYDSVLSEISPAGVTTWKLSELPQGGLSSGALTIGPDGNLYTTALTGTKPTISLVALGLP